MADNESTSVTKDLGIVSAYGYAKAAGYTGTEEEFEQIFLEFTEDAPGLLDRLDEAVSDCEDAASDAADAKTAAENAQTAAEAAAAAFETDTTLAVSGKAADAKVTGDEITGLKTALNYLPIDLSQIPDASCFIGTNGNWTVTSRGKSKFIELIPGVCRKVKIKSKASTSCGIAFLKARFPVADGYTPKYAHGETARHWINSGESSILSIPEDCTYIWISVSYTSSGGTINDYSPESVDICDYNIKQYLSISLRNDYGVNLWDCIATQYKTAVKNTGSLEQNDNYTSSAYIPVTSGEILYGYGARFAGYDNNYAFVSGATDTLNSQPALANGMHYYIIPEGVSYFRICGAIDGIDGINQFELYKASPYEAWIKTIIDGGIPDRKIYCIGDSITKGMYAEIGESSSTGPTTYGYPYWIGKYNNYSVVNLGESGAGYANKGTDTTSNGKDIVDNNTFDDADIITIALGVNDWKGDTQEVALGSMSSLSGDGTVIGNMKYMIETLADPTNGKAKKAQIIVMLPMNTNRVFSGMDSSQMTLANNWAFGYAYRNSQTLEDYRDAIKECADYYNVKVIDLEEVCPINRLNIRQVVGDGLHPTIAFYKQMGMALAPLIH